MKYLATLIVIACAVSRGADVDADTDGSEELKLGVFSVSLTVEDIKASRAFYEKLGFKKVGGDIDQRWLVLRNDGAVIGLFQGMFEKNILTFNPGWDRSKRALPSFTDVREIQAALAKKGIEFQTKADPATTGPASFVIADPDGNPILVDQHVPAPKKKGE